MPLTVSVIGTNYLGAAHAAGMAQFGHQVIGVDIDQARVDSLNAGRPTIFEPDLEPMLARHVASGQLRFTTDYAEIADWADVHFVAVGTPRAADGSADLSQVFAVADRLGPLLTRPTLVAGKSTVPVGTAARLQQRLRELAPAGDGVEVLWNPEFLREAHAVADTLRPDRIVLGAQSQQALATMRQVYARPIADQVPVVECDLATAELIKSAANTFLAMKISFINALAQMCEAAGGDVVPLADALGYDRRIGRDFLNAGLGFGGGCLPKDIAALAYRATELGVPQLTQLITAIETINDTQRSAVTHIAVRSLGDEVTGRRVAVLGAAFKPGTDDTRNSPALTVAAQLAALGAEVRVYDPQARVDLPELTQCPSLDEALDAADLVLHLTEWPQFRQLDPAALGSVVRRKVLIDARLRLDRDAWQRAGWQVIQPGRATSR